MDCHDIRKQLFEEPSEQALRIAEIEEEVFHLQTRVFEIINTLSDADKTIIEGYIYASAELELHTVVKAYNTGLKKGKEIGRSGDSFLYR